MFRRQLKDRLLVLKLEFFSQVTQVFLKIFQYEMAARLIELCSCCLYPKTVTRWSPAYHFEPCGLPGRLKQVWFVCVWGTAALGLPTEEHSLVCFFSYVLLCKLYISKKLML